ncbi:hypothetical protein PFISCL1PPCAC_18037 [Pristionchus fissidentatus]|uniref:SH2 domain-containing protein n=1 Tax=Pristionchus fissidentatus TaxID=1538716 RepID=A0AAV5W7Z8_9BILA|nr:hypothetical protein PFISCL1PPCAC_18037 [Pristionchus fissidentatus]
MPSDIRKEDYYHGLLPREDAEDLLIHTGDCLVRLSHNSSSIRVAEKHYILSICVEPGSSEVQWRRPGFEPLPKIVKHVLIYRDGEGRYSIGHSHYDTIQVYGSTRWIL